MSSRLRSLDSKISFFAFADIITAVSGVLIFVALLLATDLGRPTDNGSQSADSEIEKQLQNVLAQQAEVDAQNRRLAGLLVAVETAPSLEKLQSDVALLRVQLAGEQLKQTSVAAQMADNEATLAARDKALGLTDLKATIQRTTDESESLRRQAAKARGEMANLEQQIALAQSRLLKLRQRDGQLWLIPDKSESTKEPILVTVGGDGLTIEHFDHPDQRKQLVKVGADSAFRSYLRETKALNQYVVFEIKPSGISLFEDVVKSARDMGFDVGYDALEENRQIHFTTPPPVDELPATNAPTPAAAPPQKPSAPGTNSSTQGGVPPVVTQPKGQKTQPAAVPAAPSPPKSKSWWQRFLEWIGVR